MVFRLMVLVNLNIQVDMKFLIPQLGKYGNIIHMISLGAYGAIGIKDAKQHPHNRRSGPPTDRSHFSSLYLPKDRSASVSKS